MYALPIQFGEVAFMPWLLIMGANEPATTRGSADHE